jgi:TolB-like protein
MELIEELKRRNVFRVGVAYLALAWVVIQITDMAVPALNLPQSLQAIVFYIGIVGFPFAVFFAWAFELTPDGLKREHEVDRTASVTHHTARKIDFGIIAMLVLAVAFLVVDNYVMPGPVETDTASSDSTSTPPKEETSYNSIGVLPFLNMSNDPDQEYFSDGIAEELLNALAKLKNLQVAARTSSFAFKGQNQDIMEIGNALKVDTVLEGSVRKSGTRLRITAQLIDVANGYHLWSETYDRELIDVFVIQDELTTAIIAALKVHLDVGEEVKSATTMDNWQAYDAYLKGLHAIRIRTDEQVAAAVSYFEEATRLEPNFAAALAQQAQAVLLSATYGDTTAENAKVAAEDLLERALAVNPDLAEAHAAVGYLLLEEDDCERALLNFSRALELNPALIEALHWRALCLKWMGRLGESLELEQRAHDLDPHHAAAFTVLNDLELNYGFETDLNLEVAQASYPQRYIDYQLRQQIARRSWAQGIEMVRHNQGGEWALIFESVFTTELKQEEEGLMKRAMELEDIPFHDTYVSMLTVFGHFDRAETFLKSPEANALLFNSTEGYLGLVFYLSGQLGDAKKVLPVALSNYKSTYNSFAADPGSFVNLSISLADVLQRIGNDEAAIPYLASSRARIESLKRNGALRGYHLPEARLSVLEGDTAAAMKLLEAANDDGTVSWYSFEDPILLRLAEEPGFIALRAKFYKHLNAERSKLGWPPVDV